MIAAFFLLPCFILVSCLAYSPHWRCSSEMLVDFHSVMSQKVELFISRLFSVRWSKIGLISCVSIDVIFTVKWILPVSNERDWSLFISFMVLMSTTAFSFRWI
jgi:hypothetical protein